METVLHDLTIAECGRRFRAGSLSPVALARHALERIARHDGAVRSFITVTADRALADAERAEAELAAGRDRGPMHGIPYALKDIIDTAGIRTTCHSRLRLDHVPEADALAAARLAAAGGVLVGKLATFEFATGGTAFDGPFPPARNPWDTARIAGGSSSGSGAAVAAGFVRAALGSDTGGSIRWPAAMCGTVGLKPTYGLVPRRGVFPLSYTLDHVGPLAWTAEDAAIVLQAIAGPDPDDPASAMRPTPDFLTGIDRGIEGLRIGFVRDWVGEAAADVRTAIEAAAEVLAGLGAVVEDVTLPAHDLWFACTRLILQAEAFAVHEADLRARPGLYAQYTRERLMVGAYVSSADYVHALRLRRELAHRLDQDVLGRYHALLLPSALEAAPAMAEQSATPMPPFRIRTMPFNLTGHPAMSVCCGFDAAGLPLSLQLAGRYFDEAMLIRIAHAYEAATPWRRRRPTFGGADA